MDSQTYTASLRIGDEEWIGYEACTTLPNFLKLVLGGLPAIVPPGVEFVLTVTPEPEAGK